MKILLQKSRINLNRKPKKPVGTELVRSKGDMTTLPRHSDPRKPSDESIQLNPHPGIVAPDSESGTSRPADVDQMVSSFLSELDTLSDALKLPRSKSDQQRSDASAPIDEPERRVVLEMPLYRNIDVLLMDNAQSAAGRKRPQEELPQSLHALHGSQPPQQPSDNLFQWMPASGWTQIRSGCSRCWANFLALTHLDRLK